MSSVIESTRSIHSAAGRAGWRPPKFVRNLVGVEIPHNVLLYCNNNFVRSNESFISGVHQKSQIQLYSRPLDPLEVGGLIGVLDNRLGTNGTRVSVTANREIRSKFVSIHPASVLLADDWLHLELHFSCQSLLGTFLIQSHEFLCFSSSSERRSRHGS